MTLFTPVKPFAKINFPGGIFVVKKERNTDYCLEIFSLTSLSQVSLYKVQVQYAIVDILGIVLLVCPSTVPIPLQYVIGKVGRRDV